MNNTPIKEIEEKESEITMEPIEQLKWWQYAWRWIVKFIYLAVGVIISYKLYKECLNNQNVNNYVVIFFSIIALGCFSVLGIPVHKFFNKDDFKK